MQYAQNNRTSWECLHVLIVTTFVYFFRWNMKMHFLGHYYLSCKSSKNHMWKNIFFFCYDTTEIKVKTLTDIFNRRYQWVLQISFMIFKCWIHYLHLLIWNAVLLILVIQMYSTKSILRHFMSNSLMRIMLPMQIIYKQLDAVTYATGSSNQEYLLCLLTRTVSRYTMPNQKTHFLQTLIIYIT